jgi:hypothetical protein
VLAPTSFQRWNSIPSNSIQPQVATGQIESVFLGGRSFLILFLSQRFRVHPKRHKNKRKASSQTTLVFHRRLCANIRLLPTSYLRSKRLFDGSVVDAIFRYTLSQSSLEVFWINQCNKLYSATVGVPELIYWKVGNISSMTTYAIIMPIHCHTEYAPPPPPGTKGAANCRR